MNAYEFLNRTSSRPRVSPRNRAPVGGPPRPSLAQLRERLVRETRRQGVGDELGVWLHRVAVEAEAHAWLTPEPLLAFPLLYEEKVAAARAYVVRQRRLQAGSPRAG